MEYGNELSYNVSTLQDGAFVNIEFHLPFCSPCSW